MSHYKVLGVNDDRDFCECCGRQGLKKVVWIENTETGEIKHFGVICAGHPQKNFGVNAEINRAVTKFEQQQQHAATVTMRNYRKQGGQYIAHPTKQYHWIPADKELLAKCEKETKEQIAAHRAKYAEFYAAAERI